MSKIPDEILPINTFYDISRFPAEPGMLVFWISMSRISNAQSAEKCFEYIEHLSQKITRPEVWINFIYSDGLYLLSEEKASTLKQKFLGAMISHKESILKWLKGTWYIPKSFSFSAWNQLILQFSLNFPYYFNKLKKIYSTDSLFQSYVLDDANTNGKDISENQIHFFLEEILMFYLISKGKAKIQNEFLNNHEKWILHCYPGKPLKSEIYLYQKNFFKFNNLNNIYQNYFYDLEEEKLYDYSRVDLATL